MQKNFLELRKFLLTYYPDAFSAGNISGGIEKPPQNAVYISQAAGMMQMVAIGFAFFGDSLWAMIPFYGGQPPPWWGTVKENKVAVMCFLFFASSAANSQLNTGAFEIELDGEVIFSRIETGRMPLGQDVIQALATNGIHSRSL